MTTEQDDIDAINNAKADLMSIADRLPKEYAGTLRDIVDDLSDLVDDLEG